MVKICKIPNTSSHFPRPGKDTTQVNQAEPQMQPRELLRSTEAHRPVQPKWQQRSRSHCGVKGFGLGSGASEL